MKVIQVIRYNYLVNLVCCLILFLSSCSQNSRSIVATDYSAADLKCSEYQFTDYSGSHLVGLYNLSESEEKGGDEILTITSAGRVILWSLDQGSYCEFFNLHKELNHSAYYSKNALLAVTYKSKVWLVRLDEQKEIGMLDRIPTRISSLTFSSDGKSLIIGGSNGRIYNWLFKNKSRQEEIRTDLERYVKHSSVISSVVSHPFGKIFFSGDWSGKINAWKEYSYDDFSGRYDKNIFNSEFFADQGIRSTLQATIRNGILDLVLSEDGELLFVTFESGLLHVYKVRGFKNIATHKVHLGRIFAIATNANGELIATSGRDGSVKLWKLVKEQAGYLEPSYLVKLVKEYKMDGVTKLLLQGKNIMGANQRGEVFKISIEVPLKEFAENKLEGVE